MHIETFDGDEKRRWREINRVESTPFPNFILSDHTMFFCSLTVGSIHANKTFVCKSCLLFLMYRKHVDIVGLSSTAPATSLDLCPSGMSQCRSVWSRCTPPYARAQLHRTSLNCPARNGPLTFNGWQTGASGAGRGCCIGYGLPGVCLPTAEGGVCIKILPIHVGCVLNCIISPIYQPLALK